MRQHRELAPIGLSRATPRDRDFLEEAHLAALGPIALVGYGWTKERLRVQFRAEVALANCRIIRVGGRDAGYISVIEGRSQRYIDAFAILPNYQRHGIGGAVMRSVLAETDDRPLRLSVLRTNRARELYLRLGFRVIAIDRVREVMEWRRLTSS